MDNKNVEKLFLKEMKGFLFYSKYIWPLHSKFIKKVISPRCKYCVISHNLSPLNDQGYCSTCAEILKNPESNSKINEADISKKKFLIEDLHEVLQKAIDKGTHRFDAAVLFSGGKDSSFLVHYLNKNYPKLRIVLLTIDNTFMSPFALKNINYMIQKFDLELVTIRPPASVFNKMFRYAFLNLNNKGCSGTVDQFDGDFFHDIGRNYAKDNNIPFLISGCSKTQVEHILGLNHFESPFDIESIKRELVAGI